ncbi:MAG TPA: putative PEP-binding protein, partial [Thermoleophilaceae bacterium]|nr:putative PEP-binding protein [Thermoleophilaceae bacterium]
MGEWVLRGASASPGLATGRARVLTTPSVTPARPPAVADPREADAEPGRRPSRTLADEAYTARVALEQAASELEEIAARLRAQGRAEEAEIVETGALMARDPLLEGTVSAAVVERGLDAATALLDATDEHAAVIAALPDPLLASRSDDVRSLGRRAARIAAGEPEAAPNDSTNFILVADDVGPADVAEHCDRLEGIALAAGAVTAHAAIVARSLGIPMTVQAGDELLEVADGTFLVVDGTDGEVIANPSAARAGLAAAASDSRAHARVREQAEAELPSVTADGRHVRVLVNAATPAEIAAGLQAGAEGAGLIRTELAFLDVPRWPSKADHLRMLAPLLRGLAGRTATVRVLDFGGDKVPPFLAREPRRGIELLLAHPGALRAQLAAIAQLAGGEAEVRVLLPMVRGATDVSVTRAILDTIGHAGDKLGVGAMIELP